MHSVWLDQSPAGEIKRPLLCVAFPKRLFSSNRFSVLSALYHGVINGIGPGFIADDNLTLSFRPRCNPNEFTPTSNHSGKTSIFYITAFEIDGLKGEHTQNLWLNRNCSFGRILIELGQTFYAETTIIICSLEILKLECLKKAVRGY